MWHDLMRVVEQKWPGKAEETRAHSWLLAWLVFFKKRTKSDHCCQESSADKRRNLECSCSCCLEDLRLPQMASNGVAEALFILLLFLAVAHTSQSSCLEEALWRLWSTNTGALFPSEDSSSLLLVRFPLRSNAFPATQSCWESQFLERSTPGWPFQREPRVFQPEQTGTGPTLGSVCPVC